MALTFRTGRITTRLEEFQEALWYANNVGNSEKAFKIVSDIVPDMATSFTPEEDKLFQQLISIANKHTEKERPLPVIKPLSIKRPIIVKKYSYETLEIIRQYKAKKILPFHLNVDTTSIQCLDELMYFARSQKDAHLERSLMNDAGCSQQ